MKTLALVPALLALSTCASAAPAPRWAHAGSLVRVTVEVDGHSTPLYASPDGSGRLYLEARPGSRYAVRVASQSACRLGVVLVVDGLNVVSGARETLGGGAPGRMYVLDPYDSVLVQGWRTSLEEVRRFTFVDERQSYAARSGQANGKMGWIELAVYREQAPPPRPYWPEAGDEERRRGGSDSTAEEADKAAPSAEGAPAARSQSYPGTGWGSRQQDPVRLVSFEPEGWVSEFVTLRYEYAPALRALGILAPLSDRDRLGERERAELGGFAPPPRW